MLLHMLFMMLTAQPIDRTLSNNYTDSVVCAVCSISVMD